MKRTVVFFLELEKTKEEATTTTRDILFLGSYECSENADANRRGVPL